MAAIHQKRARAAPLAATSTSLFIFLSAYGEELKYQFFEKGQQG